MRCFVEHRPKRLGRLLRSCRRHIAWFLFSDTEEEMEMKEIAELLEEQPGTVYTRLHRAKKLLAERLGVMYSEMR